MTTKKWSEIRAQRFTPEELREIGQEVEREFLEMDLRARREAVGLTDEALSDDFVDKSGDKASDGAGSDL